MTITAYYNLFDYLIGELIEFPPTLLLFGMFFVSYAFYVTYRLLYGLINFLPVIISTVNTVIVVNNKNLIITI